LYSQTKRDGGQRYRGLSTNERINGLVAVRLDGGGGDMMGIEYSGADVKSAE
jgi:hypothetical protein